MNRPAAALDLVLELAERERDAARAASRRAEQALQAAERQAEQLRHYRGDYEQRWSTQFRTGGAAPGLLQCYSGFMDRIRLALAQQEQALAQAAQRQAQARAALLQCETRAASVRKLIERRASAAQALVLRREQKDIDERAGLGRLPRTGAHPGIGMGEEAP